MSRHEHCRELLARRRELSDAEEMRVRDHLQACAECKQLAVTFEEDAALLRALPLPEPPTSIRREMWAAMRHAREGRPS